MAPLIKTAIELLLGYVYIKSPQSVLEDKNSDARTVSDKYPAYQPSISVLSWEWLGVKQIDVYGVDRRTGQASHKWWDGSHWNPRGSSMELLGGDLRAAPSVVSSNTNVMDIFSVDNGKLLYKSFDGNQWLEWRDLGSGGLLVDDDTMSVTSAVPGRLDIFGRAHEGLHVHHKYYNGSYWMPSGDNMDDLQSGITQSAPVAISWASGRHALFALGDTDRIECLFFDGSNWSQDTSLDSGVSEPAATSWGENQVDLFAVDDLGDLCFDFWDKGTWFGKYCLSDEDTPRFVGKPAVINSFGPNGSDERMDVFIRGVDGKYYYTHGGAEDWSDWSCHGGNFSSPPAVISPKYDAQRLDVFGVTSDGELLHQMWDGQVWYPGLDQWEKLGSGLKAF